MDDEAEAPKKRGRPAAQDGVRVTVLRAMWRGSDAELAAGGGRVDAGTEIVVPAEEAMDGVESGLYSRVKDADK
jgi:hypothetical protein